MFMNIKRDLNKVVQDNKYILDENIKYEINQTYYFHQNDANIHFKQFL